MVGTFLDTRNTEAKNSPTLSLMKLTFLWRETDNEKDKTRLCPERTNAIDKNDSGKEDKEGVKGTISEGRREIFRKWWNKTRGCLEKRVFWAKGMVSEKALR